MDDTSKKSAPTKTSLGDDEIKTIRQRDRRSFLKSIGIGVAVAGAAAIAVGSGRAVKAADSDPSDGRDSDTADNGGHHSDFPKGSSDGDETTNKDLKAVDSDTNDSKGVDSDENHLRDVKRSTDSD